MTKRLMGSYGLRAAGAVLGVAALLAAAPAQAGKLTVYTSYEEDEAAAFLEKMKQDLPDIEVEMLRLSTGDLGARILAEASNPRHDVIWGWAVTQMIDPRILDMLEPYQPKGAEKIAQRFRDENDKWVAVTGYMAAFCVNNEVVKAANLPMPKSYQDLLDPAFKNQIVMPNPASSGTGYIQVASILQLKGEEEGWKFLDELDKNMGQYIKSGSKPCNMASQGEYAVGASFELRALKNIREGYPITMVLPEEGSGNELEANGIMKTTQNMEDAKRFMDWTVSQSAGEAYSAWKAIITLPDFEPSKELQEAGLPKNVLDYLYPMDFQWSADNKDRVIQEWQRRYEK